jgi:hypothetical protein
MQKIKMVLGLSILTLVLIGCATPTGMKWSKAGNSIEISNVDKFNIIKKRGGYQL